MGDEMKRREGVVGMRKWSQYLDQLGEDVQDRSSPNQAEVAISHTHRQEFLDKSSPFGKSSFE
jgi:hypothetical protein